MAIKIDYYSDVLCIWAWIAERRQDELARQFGDDVEITVRFVDVFGNTESQIGEKWAARGGFEVFGEHVRAAAATHPHVVVAPDIWWHVRPASSAPAHTVIKAVEIAHSAPAAARYAHAVREAFFTGPVDIGRYDLLLDMLEREDLDRNKTEAVLESGTAIAAVMQDYQLARTQGVRGSPSWVLDGGRQTLYGNVGYRVLHANAAELLKQAPGEASWC